MKPTHWRCSKCRAFKKLPEEIERADMYAVCRSCKQGIAPAHSNLDAPQEQQVTVHRRGFQRRHGVDRREPSGE